MSNPDAIRQNPQGESIGAKPGTMLRCVAPWLVTACLVLMASGDAFARPTNEGLHEFSHTAWKVNNGAPGDIWALAQGADGYLWLGTGDGLFRFDGDRFERYEFASGSRLASSNITALSILPSGEIWIGYYAAGVSLLKDGVIRHFGLSEGMPDAIVYRIVQDLDGHLWAATGAGLYTRTSGRWQKVGAKRGYGRSRADWALLDSRGNLWVPDRDTVKLLQRNHTSFEDTHVRVGDHTVLQESPNGDIWLSDNLRGTIAIANVAATNAPRFHGMQEAPAELADLEAARLMFAGDGSLWATDARRGGISRIPRASASSRAGASYSTRDEQRFDQQQGLTANKAVPVLQDSEGNVWVGTNLGLNRFRLKSVRGLTQGSDAAHSGFSLAPVANGFVYLAVGGALFRTDGTDTSAVETGLTAISQVFGSSVDGTVWLVSHDGLFRSREGAVTQVQVPAEQAGHAVRAMSAGQGRAMWCLFDSNAVYRYDGNTWSLVTRPPSAPLVLASDDSGRLWLGFSQSRVEVRDAQAHRRFGPAEGLDVGNVTAISPAPGRVLIAGERGLARLEGSRFHSLGDSLDLFTGITGIVESDDGDIWLNGNRGLLRISGAELDRAFSQPNYRPRFLLLDEADGLPGIAVQASLVPTAFRASTGLIWLATNQGAAWVDPGRIFRSSRAPPVVITSVTADDQKFAPGDALRLPKSTEHVRIDYSAISLSAAGKVQFRYMLEDVDHAWQEAGTRRQAFYNQLAPGPYRFLVDARMDDGAWGRRSSAVNFVIAPAFYQTTWFSLLTILSIVALLWSLYLRHLRSMGRRIHDRAQERHMERERIARELHDTLLQSIQGLVLRFQAVAETIPLQDPSRRALESALDRADLVIAEGRDRVVDLRGASVDVGDLSQALASAAEDLGQDHSVGFRLVVEGRQLPLDALVRDELFLIGREALTNAYRHSGAGRIEIVIAHAHDGLRFRLFDDGRGIDEQVLKAGGKSGHWGLSGMHERAAGIGAELIIRSSAGVGTDIEIRVPARLAYQKSPGKSRWRWPDRLRLNLRERSGV